MCVCGRGDGCSGAFQFYLFIRLVGVSVLKIDYLVTHYALRIMSKFDPRLARQCVNKLRTRTAHTSAQNILKMKRENAFRNPQIGGHCVRVRSLHSIFTMAA